ncbi:NADP-dependent oxidoreductase [Xanthocytophaga agilis]|uniref:NADP-dependent oxidoreductase n=1 Tax=Xanthocytophaga agilis TaxID=3048010 RepID=A0AAE3UGB4_9BACT|nr:NADP-dependent oxidoreductase [Xanthocytophaga agilis]MDJ1502292.1 NADP-dependent oxidoreductase [Xanthocytophaga agilis]
MKAIILTESGGVDTLTYTEVAIPQITDHEVLIQVKAISINPVDVKTRAGKGVYGRLKTISPLIIGWDISGVVVKTGNQVTKFKEGDAVFGMVNFPGHGQAYAEYVAAPESHLALKPQNISFEQAAASTLAALTAWQAFTKQTTIQPGQKVLIHAAAGGVGHFAVQVARYLGAHVTGTASAANKAFVLNLGADTHIDYRSQKFEDVISDQDLVLDAIGGENIDRSLQVIKHGGTLISIPSGLNEQVAEKAKSKGINGFFFLVQSNGEDMQQIAKLLEEGIIHPYISKVYAFSEMKDAHLQQETGGTRGKLVIRVN